MVKPVPKLQMKLIESKFPFSRRMLNFFAMAEITTVADLAAIPLSKFSCFRGFKAACGKELHAFIEFEQIHDLFNG